MIKTLIIYDTTGYIIQQMSGSYRVPVGIPYLEIDMDNYKGKIIDKIDVSVTPNVPIFMELPKTELQIAQEKIANLENYVLEKEADNTVTSL